MLQLICAAPSHPARGQPAGWRHGCPSAAQVPRSDSAGGQYLAVCVTREAWRLLLRASRARAQASRPAASWRQFSAPSLQNQTKQPLLERHHGTGQRETSTCCCICCLVLSDDMQVVQHSWPHLKRFSAQAALLGKGFMPCYSQIPPPPAPESALLSAPRQWQWDGRDMCWQRRPLQMPLAAGSAFAFGPGKTPTLRRSVSKCLCNGSCPWKTDSAITRERRALNSNPSPSSTRKTNTAQLQRQRSATWANQHPEGFPQGLSQVTWSNKHKWQQQCLPHGSQLFWFAGLPQL